MPWLVRVVFGERVRAGGRRPRASFCVAAALQLVFGWTKSFPVTIGRPGLRIVAHGIETAVLLPLVAVLGAEWGVTGAAVAMLVSSAVFAATWTVLLLRVRAEVAARGSPRAGAGAVRVLVVSGIWPPDVGGPASHAPAVAALPARPRPRRRGGDDRRRASPQPQPYPVALDVPAAAARAPPRSRHGARSPAAPARADVVYATSMVRAQPPPRRSPRAAARRQARRRRGLRARAPLAGGSSGTLEDVPAGARRRSACAPCGGRATAPCGAPRTSSAPARTCARSRSAGASTLPASPCCRTRRRRCRRCRRATSCAAQFEIDGPTLAFAGRLTSQKALDVALDGRRRRSGRRARRRWATARSGSGSSGAAPSSASTAAFASSAAAAATTSSRLFRAADAALLSSALGELPAHGRRGARRRDAGDRHRGRRCRRGGARRRERPARPAGRRGRAGGRDPPPPRRGRPARAARRGGRSVGRAARRGAGAGAGRGGAPAGGARGEAASCSWSGGRATRCRSHRRARAQVRRARPGAGRARPRQPRARLDGADPRFRLVDPAAGARRAGLLRAPAAPGRARAARVPARGGARPGRAGDGARPARPRARARARRR